MWLPLAVSVVLAAAQAQPSDPTLDPLLTRARGYVLDFVNKLASVVAEEHYIQDESLINGRLRTRHTHRDLKSDFLLVRHAGGVWQPFRDVFEVDHLPTRDRSARLAKLFLDPKVDADSDERVRAIADESARYNVGQARRTINNPVFALMFLQSGSGHHCRFAPRGSDRKKGVNLRVVEFVEDKSPTLITGETGRDMPASGRFWIERETGRVVKAEVRVDGDEIKARLTTSFRRDAPLGIDVPSEMTEDYEFPGGIVAGTATYSHFQRFEVTAKEEMAEPAAAPATQP